MLNEELLAALVNYRKINNGKTPDKLRVNPVHFKNLLEELGYSEWMIKKKEKEMTKNLLGVPIELTEEVQRFEL
ncbi:hypothetical protein ABE42_40095 [Bacillus thuringiensis]|uniref:Uncharacterized protein n=1 Tax=Bacillus thuringiensis TaxID=1428 RepID=A0A437SDB8_BACTU|nr:hypothetical protein [Bacillus thuringiensis]MBG9535599.1 hypothetical protein [Bacillus thuringiensis]MBG9585243.1 hypothetical protein [Bacillus thuringiensis]RVU60703.1 hypothetical protein BM74_30125 [Bacillus thuringiensis]RVU61576.1 hypothetical protein BM74_25125 [Bacillus thuringiensis]RVU61580.1 hypothetical protein BM74_25030 [Bacillus thuringiensis]